MTPSYGERELPSERTEREETGGKGTRITLSVGT